MTVAAEPVRSSTAGPTDAAPGGEPRLLADIGATYARFCVEATAGRFEHVRVLACADYPGFTEVMQAYLDILAGLSLRLPRHGAVAIANPVEGDSVRMTNRDWAFSIGDAQRALRLSTLLVVNNFTALAMSLPRVGPDSRLQVGGGTAQRRGVIGLVGPGTGLGVSGLVPTGERWVTLATEGGHTGFAPADERELNVLRHAWRRFPHVSTERLVSGPGLELIYEALREQALPASDAAPGGPPERLPAAEIVRWALAAECPVCVEAVDCFCAMLGTVAADLALTLGATGGIYIGGGIVPRLGAAFAHSAFRARFESKGRFSGYLARIPTFVLLGDNPSFLGLSLLLAEHLPDTASANPLLEHVRASRVGLSPAERRVADHVLNNPRSVLNDAIALIALGAEVSQPTVIRFCRSLGFQGLTDFKLKLGSGLLGTLQLQRSPVRRQDATPDLCAKVLDNTVSAIMQFRDSLHVEAVDRAIGLLCEARRVEFFGMGNSAVVALDAQHKLFRFRIPSVAQTDPSLHALAAEMLEPGDVAVFISSSGQPPELVRAAAIAAERCGAVIAITAAQSPLAKRATVCIAVEHGEDSSAFVAMISRILHLLALDMVSVGVAVRRTPEAMPAAPAGGPGNGPTTEAQARPGPGLLISHVG